MFAGTLFPQNLPKTYNINRNKKIAKNSAYSAPNSNGITDIIAMGDTVWLGTDEGLSLTTDGGNNWTKFYSSTCF